MFLLPIYPFFWFISEDRFVPRGTFEKNNIDIDSELTPKTEIFIKNNIGYKEILSDITDYEKFAESTGTEKCKNKSFVDALYILRGNTEFPVGHLSSEFINDRIVGNYRNEILEDVEVAIKYRGYIERERKLAEKIMRLENLAIPENFDFDKVQSLSIECRQKLKKYAPATIAQASRISGVSPADISVLLVYFGR